MLQSTVSDYRHHGESPLPSLPVLPRRDSPLLPRTVRFCPTFPSCRFQQQRESTHRISSPLPTSSISCSGYLVHSQTPGGDTSSSIETHGGGKRFRSHIRDSGRTVSCSCVWDGKSLHPGGCLSCRWHQAPYQLAV